VTEEALSMPGDADVFPPVLGFHGPYRFLPNFARTPMTVDGVIYPTLEHAFAGRQD